MKRPFTSEILTTCERFLSLPDGPEKAEAFWDLGVLFIDEVQDNTEDHTIPEWAFVLIRSAIEARRAFEVEVERVSRHVVRRILQVQLIKHPSDHPAPKDSTAN